MERSTLRGGEVKAVWELELEPVHACILTPRTAGKSPRFVTRHASRLESDA